MRLCIPVDNTGAGHTSFGRFPLNRDIPKTRDNVMMSNMLMKRKISQLPHLLLRGWLVAAALFLTGETALAEETSQPATMRSPSTVWLEGDGATGGWFGWRSRLSDRGLSPYAAWNGEFFRNFDGGLKTVTDWEGLLEFGVDIDLGTAMAWDGARLHASALWIQDNDDPAADFVGSFDEVSNIAGENALIFYQLYFAQEVCAGALSYKVGQLVLDDDFMVSEYAALFLNSSFGALPVQSANTPAPIFPLAALGGWAQWIPREDVSLQFGIYNGDAGTQDSNEHGVDYDFGSSEGVMVLAEAGIDTTLLGRDATWKVGGYYHSGDFEDFDSGKTESDNFALYVIVDQVLLGTRDESRLAAFFRVGVSPLADRSAIDWNLETGLTVQGFREHDRLGLGFTHSHFSDDFVSAQDRADTPVSHAESIIELTYLSQILPWLSLQPALQFVIDPQNARASDAVVGGLRANVTF